MSPAHAGPNTSGLYALGNISPVVPFGDPHTTSDGSEKTCSPPLRVGQPKLVVEMPSSEGPLACLPRIHRNTGLNQARIPPLAPESRTFHRLPKTQ